MITDPHILAAIKAEWDSVRRKQNRIKINTFSAMGHISLQFVDLSYTLILIYAYSVLHETLRQLHEQGSFSSTGKGTRLGSLMKASKRVLPWVDLPCVDLGREQRNKVAHNDRVLPRGETWKYVDAIERELVGWSIIPDPAADYSIPYGQRG